MEPDATPSRLSRIQTYWTVVGEAHGGPTETARAAQQQLWERYGKAIQRYLRGAHGDEEAAEELTQEFALRFLKGDFRGANPGRGRFRDFVKGILFHLIADYHRRQKRQSRAFPLEEANVAAPAPEPDADRQFLETWRATLLSRTWKALAQFQEQTGSPYHEVLQFRANHPQMHSKEMADRLGEQLGKPVTPAWVRQTLRRARGRLADLLLDEVAQTLQSPTREEVEREITDLGLLAYCKPALERFGHQA
jgi:RNA polymerase sigma-70 factor (ECF subfamily)